jgi:hypothetical protein
VGFAFLCGACGKKGPPLPPLVKLPAAPDNVVAERRGNIIDLQFTVPAANTDGSRPANVGRAQVYAITAPSAVPASALTDEIMIKYGTRVGEVEVKSPRDPNATADPDDPSDEVDPPEGSGLDQGARAHVEETISPALLKPVEIPARTDRPAQTADLIEEARPLLGPASAMTSRTYAAVGLSARGRRGPLSARIAVPLVPPPPPPAAPDVSYDETAVTVRWSAVVAPQTPGADDVLPSRSLDASPPAITYNVYDASDPDAQVKLTASPIEELQYTDARMAWGEQRCYAIRTAEHLGSAVIESEASAPTCETLTDTFPPAPPKGLAPIASEGAISLIWEPNSEKDLAGYLVLRGAAPGDRLTAITAAPIQETSFTDGVPRGATYVYAIQAVDRAGNASSPSAKVTETAR